ncbi:MAG TPA: DUF4399 domain-containing protein [Gammaproteobacteria bacterium]|jgi:hypothetical protein
MPISLKLSVLGAIALLAACSEPEMPAEDAAAPMQAAPGPAPQPNPTVARTPSPAAAMAYIVEPADGATATSPVLVAFGLKGIGVAPAGIESPNTGHHHLLIDTELASFDQPIPADAQHIHYGLGQTEAMVTLSPGSHTLRLVLGDHLHIPHDPPVMSDPVTIQVLP